MATIKEAREQLTTARQRIAEQKKQVQQAKEAIPSTTTQ